MMRRVLDWILIKLKPYGPSDLQPRPMERDRQRRIDAAVSDAERAVQKARDAMLEAQATVMEGRRRIEAQRDGA